jgi:hypothetical protein
MKATIYLQSDRISNYNLGQKIGLTREALEMFSFACYEVEIVVEVNVETGECVIVSVDGKEVKQ